MLLTIVFVCLYYIIFINKIYFRQQDRCICITLTIQRWLNLCIGGRRGRDLMVVGFKTKCAISACTGEMCSIHYYVIWFVSDLRQVGGFLRIPPPIELVVTI